MFAQPCRAVGLISKLSLEALNLGLNVVKLEAALKDVTVYFAATATDHPANPEHGAVKRDRRSKAATNNASSCLDIFDHDDAPQQQVDEVTIAVLAANEARCDAEDAGLT